MRGKVKRVGLIHLVFGGSCGRLGGWGDTLFFLVVGHGFFELLNKRTIAPGLKHLAQPNKRQYVAPPSIKPQFFLLTARVYQCDLIIGNMHLTAGHRISLMNNGLDTVDFDDRLF